MITAFVFPVFQVFIGRLTFTDDISDHVSDVITDRQGQAKHREQKQKHLMIIPGNIFIGMQNLSGRL